MADSIKIGNLDINAFKVGSDDCKIYLGDTLLYPSSPTPKNYLRFVAKETCNFKFTSHADVSANTLDYSLDSGTTWSTLANGVDSPSVSSGDVIMWKSTNLQIKDNAGCGTFSSNGEFDVEGNVMSLYYGDNFEGETSLSGYAFVNLFSGCTTVINADKMVLPATTLEYCCYERMFQGCTSLMAAPTLSATTLADYCCKNMFSGCTSLTSTQSILHATTLAIQCYYQMFRDCTALTAAPALGATTLATSCYEGMFQGCTSLIATPDLPLVTLADYCCKNMFNGCTSLIDASTLPATTLAIQCYYQMFRGCTSLANVPNLPATTLADSCYRSMFEGCHGITTVPTNLLPATTLANTCYRGMFYDCISLTIAPVLPAITLVSNCYYGMFGGCTSLNYIKALFTTTPSTTYTRNWVQNVASSGTFIKNTSATWNVRGNNGIPTNWTVQYASS